MRAFAITTRASTGNRFARWRAAADRDLPVDPETYVVTVDGVHATVPPAQTLPMSQLYFLV